MESKPATIGCDLPACPACAGGGLRGSVATGLGCYALTSLVAVLGVVLGFKYLTFFIWKDQIPADLLQAFANWDGRWYGRIATEGYSYDPARMSSVAFFPAYPVLAAIVHRVTGGRIEWALLVVANVFLAGSFVLLHRYVKNRDPLAPAELAPWALLAFGVLPVTFFFRMAYSESLFIFLSILSLYGMARRWPPWTLALAIGLLTAVRPAGVALIPPLCLYVWRQSTSARRALFDLAWLLPMACWGLLAYVAYQGAALGEPLAFVKAQDRWCWRPPFALSEKLYALATLEPVWSVYDPASRAFWERAAGDREPLFSLAFINPVYFVSAVALVVLGIWKRWLNSYEALAAAGLLFIPYFTKAYETGMQSQARYAAAAFPIYLVLGQLLCRIPGSVAGALAAISLFLLGVYAAMFAAAYVFI